MWFTRVSLKNPVFATMLMLALVVLGMFSYQRLQVDQFPNIDFPVVVAGSLGPLRQGTAVRLAPVAASPAPAAPSARSAP